MKIIERMDKESRNLVLEEGSSEIDGLIILDRKVDLLTPLLTQLSYAGLLDEEIGVGYKSILVRKSDFRENFESLREDSKGKEGLDQYWEKLNDEIFEEIKDLDIQKAWGFLEEKAGDYKKLESSVK